MYCNIQALKKIDNFLFRVFMSVSKDEFGLSTTVSYALTTSLRENQWFEELMSTSIERKMDTWENLSACDK